MKLDLSASQLSPRTLETGPGRARIALVATTALLLAGDDVEVVVDVGEGCHLEIVDTAGTVAYDGQGSVARWTVTVRVADGGSLLWNAEPFVVATGADVLRSTRVELTGSGAACLRETLVLGRSGEVGGALLSSTTVTGDGRPLLTETLDLRDPEGRRRPGILGAAKVVDTLALLGRRVSVPSVATARIFALAGTGTIARFLGPALHRSGVPDRYPAFVSALRGPVA